MLSHTHLLCEVEFSKRIVLYVHLSLSLIRLFYPAKSSQVESIYLLLPALFTFSGLLFPPLEHCLPYQGAEVCPEDVEVNSHLESLC